MIIDLAVALVFLYMAVIGFRRGFGFSVLHGACTVVALIISNEYYLMIARRLELFVPFPKTLAYDMKFAVPFEQLQQRFYHIIAFIFIAIIVKLILYAIVAVFDNMIKQSHITLWSRITSVIVSIITSLVVVNLALYVLAIYPNEMVQSQLSASLIAKPLILNIPFLSHFILKI